MSVRNLINSKLRKNSLLKGICSLIACEFIWSKACCFHNEIHWCYLWKPKESIISCACMWVWVWACVLYGCVHAKLHVWRSEDYLQKLTFSFDYLGCRDQTRVARLGSQHFYTMSCLADPVVWFLKSLICKGCYTPSNKIAGSIQWSYREDQVN